MANIVILYCRKIQDHSCVACAKCFKGMDERAGEFARYEGENLHLVGLTDCGDCPGLAVPRLKLVGEVARMLERPIDAVHLGTCIKTAMETGGCPLDFDELRFLVEQRFGCRAVLGTHPY